MSIRFHCPACHQPIEVDDSDAGRKVVCFYCQAVVTAPRRTEPVLEAGEGLTTGEPGQVELRHISELGRDVGRATVPVQAPPSTGPSPRRGPPFGTIGFIAAVALVVLILCTVVWVVAHTTSTITEPHFRQLSTENQREVLAAEIDELVRQRPDVFKAVGLATLVLAFSAMAFSLIGLTQNRPKGLAVAALIIALGFLIFQCAGLFTLGS